MKEKNILTIETSLGRVFLVLFKNKSIFYTTSSSSKSIEEVINSLIEKVFSEAQIEFTKLDLILVSLGPGSFTGIRIGISAAKAMSLATGAKIIGFSNFQSIINQFFFKNIDKKKQKVEVLVKGPGEEFFKQIFNKEKEEKNISIITKNKLIKDNQEYPNTLRIGDFTNNFGLKNYYLSLPDYKGFEKLAFEYKNNGNFLFKTNLTPMYVKKHYAKK